MPETAAAENLLLGILALHKDFVRRDELVAGVRAWALDKSRPLGQLLVERQALRPDQLGYLEALVRDHLGRHGNDVRKALAASDLPGAVWLELAGIADGAVQASLSATTTQPAPEAGDATLVWAREAEATAAPPARDDATLTWFAPADKPPQRDTLPVTQRYEVLRPHACSGLGLVLIARDEQLGREVALKEIEPEHDARPERRARFLREVEVAARLEHPGIVPIYGLGALPDGRPFYAMRFFEGESFADAIAACHRRGRHLPPGERSLALRRLLGQFVAACQAAGYAHGRGVIHRDLSPHTIAVGKHGETVLVEWGLAKVVAGEGRREPWAGEQETEVFSSPARVTRLSDRDAETTVDDCPLTPQGQSPGMPAYMSPEQAAGRWDEVGPASDVYSLGATLYHLLAGRPPLEGDAGTVLRRAQRGDYPPPRRVKPDVPRALEAICLKAMALAARDRYGSAAALAEDVERWLAGEPVRAYREPLAAKLGRWLRRHAAAAVLLLVAGGLGVALWMLPADGEELRLAAEREAKARTGEAKAREGEAKARQELQENFTRAVRAVDESLLRAAEEPRLKEGDLAPLRRHLLGQAAAYYREYLKSLKDDPAREADLGHARAHLGFIHKELAERKEGIANLLEARAVFRRLVERDPLRADYQYSLGWACLGLGELYRDGRDYPEAEKILREALPPLEKAALAQKGVAKHRRDLGAAHSVMAQLHAAAGRQREARDAGLKAVVIFARLVEDDPAGTDHRYRLAEACNVVAGAQLALGEPHESVARQGLAALDPLARKADSARLRPLLASLEARAGGVPPGKVAGGVFRGKLTDKDPFDEFRPKTTKAYRKIHEMDLAAGKSYQIDLSGDFDTFLRVADPAGKLLLQNDDVTPGEKPPETLHSRVVFTPGEAGKYRLIVTSFAPEVTGAYTLRVREAAPAGKPLVEKAALTEKERKGEGQYVQGHKIELTAGRAYVIEAASSAFAPGLFLLDAEGKDAVTSGRGKQVARIDYTPVRTGTYAFVVAGATAGAYTLSVQGYVEVKGPPGGKPPGDD